MFKVTIKSIKGYPRSISYSNRLTGLLKMILGNSVNINFSNGEFIFNIECSKSNLLNLIKLIESNMKKIFLDSFYKIDWKEV